MAVPPSAHLLLEQPPAEDGKLVLGQADDAPTSPAASPGRLLFWQPPASTGKLVFGETDDVPSPPGAINVTAVVRLGGVTVRAAASYDNRVTRWLDRRVAAPHQVARSENSRLSDSWGITVRELGGTDMPWERAQSKAVQSVVVLQATTPTRQSRTSAWTLADQVQQSSTVRHQASTGIFVRRTAEWQTAEGRNASATSRMQAGIAQVRELTPHWQPARAQAVSLIGLMGASSRRIGKQWSVMPWQIAGRAMPGLSVLPSPKPSVDPCYLPNSRLLFDTPWTGGAGLVFICERHGPDPERPQFVIPLLKVYMAVHELKGELLPSLESVVLRDVAIASDDDGYGWSFSGSGPEHLLDQLAPRSGLPQQIRVTLDGISWVFAVLSLSRTRRFGEHRVAVRGASITALLGSPYMPEQTWLDTNGATAQQLVAQALQYTGVGVQWDITDWYVPPGVWSFQGTPLAAALRVAEAAGGVLRSHRTDSELIFAPRYRAMPWEWGAAEVNVEMPAAVITTDELRDDTRPDYNAVYVSGQSGGVLGYVRRTGTAGDVLAPQVTDGLITHADAARQRGRAVLGAGGKKLMQTVTMPLLTGGRNPGLVQPGYLVQVNDIHEVWRGLVRGISVNASMPSVRQTIAIERLAA